MNFQRFEFFFTLYSFSDKSKETNYDRYLFQRKQMISFNNNVFLFV